MCKYVCSCLSVHQVYVCILTCTFRASSEFCDVSSSICLRSSATVPGSAGAGEGCGESASPWEMASSGAGEALERLESNFSEEKVQVQEQQQQK